MNKNKIIFWSIYAGLLALVPITILPSVNFTYTLAHPAALLNLIQRFIGLTAFVLLFWQLMIGANMTWVIDKLGAWIFKFHIAEGITIYTLALLHPIVFTVFNYFGGRGIDPFYVFLDFCVLCKTTTELYYTLGRVSFWLLNIAVFAGLFRAATPFMRVNWRKFHVFNYVVFLLIGIHGLSIGTDFMRMPYFIFAAAAYLIILYVVIFRKIPELVQNLRRYLA